MFVLFTTNQRHQLYSRRVYFLLLLSSFILNFGSVNLVQNNDNDSDTRRLKVVDVVSARHSSAALPAWATASSNNGAGGGVAEVEDLGGGSAVGQRRVPQIADVRAECSNPDKMNIGIKLDTSFNGIIYAKGHFGKPECMFTKPNTESKSFNITAPVEICGTKVVDKERNLKISSVVLQIQQDPNFVESSDYARDIRCTWSLRFDQVVTMKPFSVTDAKKPDRVEFSGDELSVMMDVRLGRNPFSGPSLGNEPVSLGTEMTIVVFVKSDTVEPHSIDVVVRDCQARDVEKGTIVPLTDENGCVLQPKLISPFRITLEVPLAGVALASYAVLQSFKFPDTPRVSLTCNVALCKESCGIVCPAVLTAADQQSTRTAAAPTVSVPQLTAAAAPAKASASNVNVKKRIKREDTQADKQPTQLRASRQLMGSNLLDVDSDSQSSAAKNNPNMTTQSSDNFSNFENFRDPHFIDLSQMRAQRVVFDTATRMQQVQVGHDIMVVADTKADQVHHGALRDRLSSSGLFADDDQQANTMMDPALLAARATHLPNKALEEPPALSPADVRLAGIGSNGRASVSTSSSKDVTELKCADADGSYNHWIIIAFLLVLLMLLLAIIVVLAMFINHYRNEAREAKQKYKLYSGGTTTPATYYVASSSPTYQVYASGCETRTQILKGTTMPITTPHLIASTNFQAINDIHPTSAANGAGAGNNNTYSTWTNTLDDDEHADDDDRNRQVMNDNEDYEADTNTLRQRNNNIDDTQVVDFSTHMRNNSTNVASLASRSLCRSLPSLAGAFHDQQLTLVPMNDEEFFSTCTLPPPPRTVPPPPPLSTLDAMSAITAGGGEGGNLSEYGAESIVGMHHHQLPMPSLQAPIVPMRNTTQQQQQFEGDDMNSIIMLRSHSPAKEECRSMASCVVTNADLLSTDGRTTSVSTFRPSSLAERNKK